MAGNATAEEQETLRAMLAEAIQFVSDVLTGQPPRWLFLCGRSGTGKTHLSRRIADFLVKFGQWAYMKHGKPVANPMPGGDPILSYTYAQAGPLFVKWAQLVDTARDGDFEAYRLACSDYFKVVDDVGSEGFGQDRKPTAFVVNQLGKLADARMGKWTVFTSNYMLKDFQDLFDVRIASRMLREGNVAVQVDIRDFNLRATQ